MPTHAEIAAGLLKDAAAFFRTLAAQNEHVRTEMGSNATIYEQMADTLSFSPTGVTPQGHTYAALAARLLKDTAKFYRQLAAQNPPIQEQMETNAGIFEQIAAALVQDPLGVME